MNLNSRFIMQIVGSVFAVILILWGTFTLFTKPSACLLYTSKILINGRTFFTSAKKINLQSHISAFMIGLSNVGAYGLMYRAYQAGGEVGRIDSLNNLVIFMVIIGEYIFFKDSHSLKRKIIAGMIAVCGAYLLR